MTELETVLGMRIPVVRWVIRVAWRMGRVVRTNVGH